MVIGETLDNMPTTTTVSNDPTQLMTYLAWLTTQHPDAVAVVLHPDTLEIVKTWVKNNIRMVDDPEQTNESIYGKTIITSEDLSVGTVLIAY